MVAGEFRFASYLVFVMPKKKELKKGKIKLDSEINLEVELLRLLEHT
jgi:hypothetical protein